MGTAWILAAELPGADNPLLWLLMQVALILGLAQIMGMLFSRLNQPKVIGEMIAGILLGPSLLGWWKSGWTTLFPPESIQYLNLISQIGVIFFLFLIGLELDPRFLRKRGVSAAGIAISSILTPLALGVGLGIVLIEWTDLFEGQVNGRYLAATLFMGTAMSVTAFPVLARILTERNLHKTPMGAMAIACAAFNDVAAWVILALVIGIAQAGGGGWAPVLYAIGRAAGYLLVMFLLVRPLLRRVEAYFDRQGRLSQGVLAFLFLLVVASAAATEAIGIHAMFGAFVLGFIMPKGTRFVRHLSEKLEDFTVAFLLPIFFAHTGLKTQIGLLNEWSLWGWTFVIIAVACAGKLGGAAVAARIGGMSWRESSAIGILMNTRGLMELVILTIGLQMGLIGDRLFAMMVIMALVTTIITTPLLNWVYPARLITAAKRALSQGFSILIPLSLPKSGRALVHLADMISGGEPEDRSLSLLYLRRPSEHEAYRAGLDAPREAAEEDPIRPAMQEATALKIPAEAVSFVTRDVAADIAAVATEHRARLILMGFHKPVIGQAILGGTVHRVLTEAPTDVAIFVDRGFGVPAKILVPFMGSRHDRLALELAHKIAQSTKAAVTVLHVVSPRAGKPKLNAKGEVDQVFTEPGQSTPVTMRVVEHDSPVDVVLKQSPQFDLVIIGVAEEWGLQSQLFGWKPERIARDCPSSLLLVRRHETAKNPA